MCKVYHRFDKFAVAIFRINYLGKVAALRTVSEVET
jgi:hypothetical protein